MNRIVRRLVALLHELKEDQQGQDLIEYSMLLSIIILLAFATFPPFSNYIINAFSNIAMSLA